MKKLIEFKLHAGEFPYFVENVIGGVEIDGKRYGISKDTKESYLPDTILELSPDEFIEKVKSANILKSVREDETAPMTDDEKEIFVRGWLEELIGGLYNA